MKFGVWCVIGAASITRTNISHEKKNFSLHDKRLLLTHIYITFLEIKNSLWTSQARKYYAHTANYFTYAVAGIFGEWMISQRL